MHKLTFMASALLLALAGCAAPPLTYDEIVTLSPEAQIDARARATPEEQAAIFRESMKHWAAKPGITEAQRAAVVRAAAEVTPADYGPRARSRTDHEMRERAESDLAAEQATYVGAIRTAFGEQAGRILYSLR